MVKAKANLFHEDLILNAEMFKALSHPARLKILQYLAHQETCITGDISDELPLSRTTVNQHIKELKEVGLIKGTIDGVKTKYCLNSCKIKELNTIFLDFFKTLENASNSIICK